MRRVRCIVQYDGTNFAGYQVQPGKRTVQREIEQALTMIHKGQEIRIAASGRTDAGVHAFGQVFHFDTPLSIPAEKWPIVIQTKLPSDIVITKADYVQEDFHSRFSVKRKTYCYKIYTGNHKTPFKRNYAYFEQYDLDINKMKKAASKFLGVHDFTAFCSAKTEIEDKVREIYSISVEEQEGDISIQITGNGFLYNMVRIMVGTLLEIGRGTRPVTSVETALQSRFRQDAGKTAPPHGLYLWSVDYE
ncbi:tRNA pseudouridine(38-40) synthase TruA [Mangrovibacillus cuniculi]|uniref:tRNA pseudouridine synthase A n=1 Tax=Mangrovibacillus cuniculi TaxID=2593652 RepID=A0A7S8HGZ0_9BACI|nr:tRNA pseudouridine(38-40) synthase TruA [Mangrovibacillus cuniculi]QPC48066.1 tRNA pseudouridine(38-40) synthase TruA [Mangrovibacillus cuniculi]